MGACGGHRPGRGAASAVSWGWWLEGEGNLKPGALSPSLVSGRTRTLFWMPPRAPAPGCSVAPSPAQMGPSWRHPIAPLACR